MIEREGVSMASRQAPVFEDLEVGAELPALTKRPTTVQLFRYSAVTWNAHRIHYDQEYAASEGYPGVLVHSHLHGAFLTQLCTDWMGLQGKLRDLELSVQRFAVPGETLTCRGRIVDLEREDGRGLVTVKLEEVNEEGEVCAPGRAVIELPLREQ
jgi:hydroxyacyl-ACP dehydratase HTD2-like protein with hotdog domain